jgi:hypothetical protein
MRKLLLTTAVASSVIALAAFALPFTAVAQSYSPTDPLYAGPSPYVPNQERSLGWVAAKYVRCLPGDRYCYVQMPPYVAGINVRQWPDGPVEMALVNGTPLIVFTTDGNGLNASFYYVGVEYNCPLIPTGLWSGTAGVPVLACGPSIAE